VKFLSTLSFIAKPRPCDLTGRNAGLDGGAPEKEPPGLKMASPTEGNILVGEPNAQVRLD